MANWKRRRWCMAAYSNNFAENWTNAVKATVEQAADTLNTRIFMVDGALTICVDIFYKMM